MSNRKVERSYDVKATRKWFDAMERDLGVQFTPEVRKLVGRTEVSTDVRFVEMMPAVKGIRFDMTVKPVNKMTTDEYISLVNALDTLCDNNSEQTFELQGYKFLLGDGDDSDAVTVEDGVFHIWLRGWKE